MQNDFCPDCGHLLPKARNQCTFCKWSDSIEGFDPDQEKDRVYIRVDEVFADLDSKLD